MATSAMRLLVQAAAAIFRAGSGASILASMLPTGTLAALHSWEQPASEALDTSTPLSVHSAREKTRGTGLYTHLHPRLSLDGVEAAPRARRTYYPFGAGMHMRTTPTLEAMDGDNLRGVHGAFGDGVRRQCSCIGLCQMHWRIQAT